MVDVLIQFLYRSVSMLCMAYLILSRRWCWWYVHLSLCWNIVFDLPNPVYEVVLGVDVLIQFVIPSFCTVCCV